MAKLSRRDAVRLGALGVAGTLQAAAATVSARSIAPVPPSEKPVPVWEIFEAAFTGPSGGNPFVDVQFGATFRLGHRSIEVEGFYDGAGRYKVRFMPDTPGDWSYTTRSNHSPLDGHQGSFTAVPAKAGVHGPVRVTNTCHFAYQDGTPYLPFGTTCYAWVHQSEELQQQTLNSLAHAPFNKIRMCVFPKHYEYNHNEPPLYPFERDASGKSDFTKLNPAFFAHIEQRILDLQKLGIEADLILFHPYDRWGYQSMPAEDDGRYLRYVLARFAAYRNIWWSVANEFDLMRAKKTSDFDRMFHLIEQYDPYAHLRSIHYSKVTYDYARPWVTHGSLQASQFETAPEFRKAWMKPVIFDEVQYEGNLNRRWGNISGPELAHRFWLGIINGAYVTHGETLLQSSDPLNEEATPTLWWSHGGVLHGTSPKMIGFLRKLAEQAMKVPGARVGFEPAGDPYYLNATVYAEDGKHAQTILYYFDTHQPVWYEFPLPEGTFTAELIDPDAETVAALDGRFRSKTELKLAGRPYQAVRFRAVDGPTIGNKP